MKGLTTTARLLAGERRARLFFLALTQSSLGTGAAYVALLIIAYERYRSAWAISAVLLVELLPSMLLGPVLGAAADRWSRRSCLVIADLLRAGAFGMIVLVPGIELTIFFAFVGGLGTALFKPAALAALPSLVARENRSAATSLYGAIVDLGFTAGPAVAAVGLLFGGAEVVLLVNASTFLISAGLLWRLAFGTRVVAERSSSEAGLWREAREGVSAVMAMSGIRLVIAGSTGALLCAGLFNVAELPFATEVLNAGDAGYSVLVAAFGVGFVGGSLSGAGGGSAQALKRRYVSGIVVMAVGFIACGLSGTVPVALVTFALAGFGNGLLLVHERLLIQETVADGLQGRVFAISDTLVNWGFAVAFLGAGAVLSAVGEREVIVAAGAFALLVGLVTAIALRSQWRADADPDRMRLGRSAHAAR
ncbi:MAG: MFS transporter [Actinomycetota bacterium]|nr:MFS transporter [Actinomycetota bacterium]